MKLLTNEHQEAYENTKICYRNGKKNLKINMLTIKNIVKLQVSVIILVTVEILHIAYAI